MPTVIECASACTVELVFPWDAISLAESAQIAAAVLAVWVVGFGFRALIQLVKDSSTESKEE